MKTKFRILPPLAAAAFIATAIVLPSTIHAQTWTGNGGNNDFNNAANWNAALGTNSTLQINGPGTQGNSTLGNATYTFTGVGGKIAFGASSNMTITGGTINIFNATNDAILAGVSGVTATVGSNLILGDGSAATTILTSNVAGAMLRITGSITGGTGGTAGTANFSLGGTSSKNGDYDISGNITRGATATALTLTKRGLGNATLSGINVINTLQNSNEAGQVIISGGNTTISTALNFSTGATASGMQVTGGTLNLTMADSTSGWGTGSTAQTFRVSGGVVNTTSGRSIDPNILIDGGTLNINTGASRMSFASANATLTISSGALNVGVVTNGARFGNISAAAANQAGAGNFTATQTGGTVSVVGAGGPTTVFSLGGNDTLSSTVIAYNLSGGTLDVGNSTTNTNGYVQLGANSNGNGTTTLALSGTGKLISRFNPATSGGISGAQAGGVQVLSLTGGTLAAGRIDTTNLRGSIGGTNGTIINNGTTIAPGDIGSTGRTAIVGNLTINTGTVSLDLGGTSASVVWQNAPMSGAFDNITVTGNLVLGGSLAISLIDGFTPTSLNSFTVLTSAGLTGAFSNVAFGGSLMTVGGEGSFTVTQSGNNVVLTNFVVIPEPSTYVLLGLGLLGMILLHRRTRRA